MRWLGWSAMYGCARVNGDAGRTVELGAGGRAVVAAETKLSFPPLWYYPFATLRMQLFEVSAM